MRTSHRSLQRQRGLGWFGLLIVLALIGFFSILAVKSFPVYMNEFTLRKAVQGVAGDPELASADTTRLRNALQRRWDIDDIKEVTPKDIKIKRVDGGRLLTYHYEARTHLFYNISMLIEFQNEVMLRGGGSALDGIEG